MDVEEINTVVEEEGETWMTPIINCLEKGIWLEDQNEARALWMKINQYTNYVIREIHMGACSMHLKARLVVAKAIRLTIGQRCIETQEKKYASAYGTSLKTSNGKTPYSLTFGSEAVIPAEIDMPTHRTMMIKEGEGNGEEMRLNLDLLTKRREAVAIREARYKIKMEQYYNKRVRPMSFRVGEHVYQKNKASRVENLGKLGPK
ncbi:hypothetical protein Tco_0554018 [Tanacetum coccineum]